MSSSSENRTWHKLSKWLYSRSFALFMAFFKLLAHIDTRFLVAWLSKIFQASFLYCQWMHFRIFGGLLLHCMIRSRWIGVPAKYRTIFKNASAISNRQYTSGLLKGFTLLPHHYLNYTISIFKACCGQWTRRLNSDAAHKRTVFLRFFFCEKSQDKWQTLSHNCAREENQFPREDITEIYVKAKAL